MNAEARKSFEHTLGQIMYERTGSRWKLERKRTPPDTAPRKLRRLPAPAQVRPFDQVPPSPHKHAVQG